MRFVAVADTHLGLLSGRTAAAKQERANHVAAYFRYCAEQAIQQDVDAFLHAGDVFNRSQPPPWAMDQYYRTVELLLDEEIEVYVIPGNHDRGYLQPSLVCYLYDSYHVFNQFGSVNRDDCVIIGSPYIKNDFREMERRIEQLCQHTAKPVIILLHQLFPGATFGPHRHVFENRPDLVRLDLPERAQVIAGHVHRPQVINQQVIYSGSTCRTSFAEMIEPKGYLVGEITSRSFACEFVATATSPMHVIEVDSRTVDLDLLALELNEMPPQNQILIRLLHGRVPPGLIGVIYHRFPASRWPYLKVVPYHGKGLRPLYSTYKDQFDPPRIKRWFNEK